MSSYIIRCKMISEESGMWAQDNTINMSTSSYMHSMPYNTS